MDQIRENSVLFFHRLRELQMKRGGVICETHRTSSIRLKAPKSKNPIVRRAR